MQWFEPVALETPESALFEACPPLDHVWSAEPGRVGEAKQPRRFRKIP